MMKLKGILVAALLLAPTAALAAPGIVTASVGLRAGPGLGFPVVDRIPAGSHVNIHGCLKGDAWCDVSWSDDRGWMSSQYLEYFYRNHYVYLPDYVDEVDVPVVPFVLDTYWSSYYAGRPWYHRRAYWNNYWTSHSHYATQLTVDPRAARIGRAATRVTAVTARESGTAQTRGGRETRGRAAAAQAGIARENTVSRAAARAQQPMAAHARMQPQITHGHQATHVSAAPAVRPVMPHIAQPNVGRGSPMNAHAQMPAPHAAAPAMPHVGGAPHVNAAPRVGGGAPAGGPSGHGRH